MPEFFFQRYVNGERMADDVLITKQATLEDAIPAALRLCRNSPKSVLVHIPQTPWRDIESAPKDGTYIDLWANNERISDARWNDRQRRWEAWSLGDYDGMEFISIAGNPTHWMPLPEPPR